MSLHRSNAIGNLREHYRSYYVRYPISSNLIYEYIRPFLERTNPSKLDDVFMTDYIDMIQFNTFSPDLFTLYAEDAIRNATLEFVCADIVEYIILPYISSRMLVCELDFEYDTQDILYYIRMRVPVSNNGTCSYSTIRQYIDTIGRILSSMGVYVDESLIEIST